MSELWGDVDPTSLYFEDGSLNEPAVQQLLDASLGSYEAEPWPLDDQTVDAYSLTISLPDLSEKTDLDHRTKQETVPRSVEGAVVEYVARTLLRGIEFPTGPKSTRLETPDVDLALQTELGGYMDFLESEQPAIFETTTSGRAMLGDSPNSASDLKCIVAIPVAGHQEAKNIYQTLAQFSKQDLGTDEFEIVLHVNLPASLKEKEKDKLIDRQLSADLQLTIDEIRRFNADHPHVVVRHFSQSYRGEQKPTIGTIRSDLWSVVGYDLQQRGREEDILVISADADITHLNRSYLRGMVETFEKEGTDIVTASLRWQMAPGLPSDSYANRVLMYQMFLDNVRDRYNEFLHTADANTGLSLAMYCAVGGFDRTRKLGEMGNLTNRIRYCRLEDPDQAEANTLSSERYVFAKPVEAKSQSSWLKTNSRRVILAMALGYSPYYAWDQSLITFGSDDSLRVEAVRSDEAEKMAEANWKKWLKEMTPMYSADLPLAKKRRLLKGARKLLGFSDLYK